MNSKKKIKTYRAGLSYEKAKLRAAKQKTTISKLINRMLDAYIEGRDSFVFKQ